MSDESSKGPDTGPEDLGPLEAPRRGGIGGLIVVLAIAGGLIFGLFWMDRKNEDHRMVKQTEEDYGFRAARLPEPPRTRPAELPAQPDPDATVNKPKPREIPDMQAQQAEAALAYAERMEAAAREQSEQERRAMAEREAEAQKKKAADRLRAPILVESGNDRAMAGDAPQTAQAPPSGDQSVMDLFAAQAAANAAATEGDQRAYGFLPAEPSDVAKSVASIAPDQSTRIRQGKIISAVLKTAINSDLPTTITALVQEDVYSDDATQVLIPRGSELVGEYRSGIQRGQRRIGVIWHRLVRPDGVDVALESAGADPLGVAGLTGKRDTHFWERFGSAIILSFIEAEAERGSEGTQVYASDLQRTSEIALRDSINIPPTIHVDQGARITIVVARDLYFHGPMAYTLGVPVAAQPMTLPVVPMVPVSGRPVSGREVPAYPANQFGKPYGR